MLCEMQSQCLQPFYCNKFPLTTLKTSPASFSIPVKCSTTSSSAVGDTIPSPLISKQNKLNTAPFTQSVVAAVPPDAVAKNIGFRPTPQFGLLSHFFVLSMAFCAFFSVAVVSIPTMIFSYLDIKDSTTIYYGSMTFKIVGNNMLNLVNEYTKSFGRLGASMKKLSKVVSEEVPGTLTSLKLSSMELNNLTQQLTSLRHKISGVRIEKKDGNTTGSRSFSKNQAS